MRNTHLSNVVTRTYHEQVVSDLRDEIDELRLEVNATRKVCFDNARLRAEVERLTIKPGEIVARWGMCPMCLGCKKYYNQYADREFECSICNGTGRVAVPVEAGK